MFSSAEKTNRTNTVVQQKAPQQTFFRKAGDESFFGAKEQPHFFNAPVQAKLSVSSPDDPQEKEADAVADKVMRMPETVGSISAEGEKKIDEKEEERELEKSKSPDISKVQAANSNVTGQLSTASYMQRSAGVSSDTFNEADNNIATGYISRKSNGLYNFNSSQRNGRAPPASSIPFAQSLSSSKGGGNAMVGSTRKFMESRFNADFSGVRIHNGPQANAMNKSIQAKAFAHGNDIYFNEGNHDPQSPEGAKLLAHELTHTIQQGASPQNLKNNNKTENPGVSSDQPVKEQKTLLPQTALQTTTDQPDKTHNDPSKKVQSPVKDELSKHNQPHEQIKNTSVAGAPAATLDSAGGSGNKRPAKSPFTSHATQTKPAKANQGGENKNAVEDTQRVGSREEGQVKADNAAIINDRINGAKASVVKTSVVVQAAIINQDYFNTETRLDNINTTKREQIRDIFIEAHANLDAFFARSTLSLTAAILAAQATVTEQVIATLNGVQTFVNSMSALALSIITNTIAFVSTLIANTLAAIAVAINIVGNRVTNLVNSISLPDLPGVETIRGFIANSIYAVSGLITGALISVQQLIASALAISLQFLTGLVQTIADAVNTIISAITLILNQIISTINASLQTILRIGIVTLQTLLNNSIHPMLVNIEAMIIASVNALYQKALQDARENREQALEALAGMIGVQTEPAPASGKPLTMAQMLAAILAISKQAIERNKEIADRFEEDTSILIGILRDRSAVFTALVIAALIGGMAAIMMKVMELISFIIQAVSSLAARVIGGFTGFVGRIIASIATFIKFINAFILDPFRNVIAYGESGFNILVSFAANVVSRFINGVIGLITRQAPVVQPHVIGARGSSFLPGIIVGTIINDIVKIIAATFAAIAIDIILTIAAVITQIVQIIVTAITIGMETLLMFFLLWRFVTASKGKPYPKLRPLPAITHETKFNAPDGSPKTRNKVGVGEKVEFTGNTVADWTASGGTPLVMLGKDKFKWTAPERAETVTIKFSVGGNDVTEDIEVIEPSHYTAIKLREISIAAGTQGAGMKLDFSFHPKTVSFGNVEQMEVSGPASNISDYYLSEGMPHHHNSGDRFFAISEDNKLATAEDTASQEGYPSPWDKGTFDWLIPNHFKLKTETGNGKKYHEATQSFRMADTTGKTKISKEGESVERSP